MEGYGLDAYLHLPRLGVACENLPSLVRHSPGGRDSTPGRNVRNFTTMGFGSNTADMDSVASPLPTSPLPPPVSTELLVEELRNCLTQEAKNQRIWAFLESRACY